MFFIINIILNNKLIMLKKTNINKILKDPSKMIGNFKYLFFNIKFIKKEE